MEIGPELSGYKLISEIIKSQIQPGLQPSLRFIMNMIMLRLDMSGQALNTGGLVGALITWEGDAIMFASDMILQDSIRRCPEVALIAGISHTLVFGLNMSMESGVC